MNLLMPTDCKLCYWGRIAAFTAIGIASGTHFDTFWLLVPFVAIMGLMTAAKWIVKTYSN